MPPEALLPDQIAPEIQELSTPESIDSIVNNFQYGNQTPNPQEAPQPTKPQADTPPNIDAMTELDQLASEIDSAALVGKTPESIASFEGLKARYKNKISEIKTQLESLKSEKETLSQQASKASELEAKIRAFDTMTDRNKYLEQEAEKLRADVEKNAYYRRKYDFENDPEVRRAFVAPMEDLKAKSQDIIQNAGLDDSVWSDLISADSEYKVNSIIDAADISGMNAQSLKTYVNQYKTLNNEFKRASDPAYIDSTLQAIKGQSQRVSEEVSAGAFNDVKDHFSNHVREIQYSDINKEHNIFVHDKVVAKAKETFDALRKTLSSEYQNPNSMRAIAQASIMTAAYPFQKKMVDHLLQERAKLLKEIKSYTSGPSISQSTESKSTTSDPDFIQSIANKSLDEIANDMFSSL